MIKTNKKLVKACKKLLGIISHGRPAMITRSDIAKWDKAVAYAEGALREAKDQGPADVQLMSAAPELLEALEEAQSHLEYCGYGDKWEREVAEDRKLSQKIETALAKAKGGT